MLENGEEFIKGRSTRSIKIRIETKKLEQAQASTIAVEVLDPLK